MELIYLFIAALVGSLLGEFPPFKQFFDYLEEAARRAVTEVQFQRHLQD